MADRQGKCINFGNCSKADNKEIISIPVGADFVCPEPGCEMELVLIPSNSGWVRKYRLQILVGVLVIVLASGGLIGYKLLKGNRSLPAEEEFLTQVNTVLEECYRTGTGITPDIMNNLKQKAEILKITDKFAELLQFGKQNFLQEKTKALGTDATPHKLKPLCGFAKKLGVYGVIQGCSVPYQNLVALLNYGDFFKTKELCNEAENDHQIKILCNKIEMPIFVETRFQYKKTGDAISSKLFADKEEINALTLTNKDNYKIFVSVSQENTYLYMFQKDQHGVINRLFPDPVWTKGIENPLAKNTEYRIPTGEKEWFYLDELISAKSDTILETIYIIASPWRAMDIEDLYGKIHENTTAEGRKILIDKFTSRLQARNDQKFKCLYYKEIVFKHGK